MPRQSQKRTVRAASKKMAEVAGPLRRMRSGYVVEEEGEREEGEEEEEGGEGEGEVRREMDARRVLKEERGVVRRGWWIWRARGMVWIV